MSVHTSIARCSALLLLTVFGCSSSDSNSESAPDAGETSSVDASSAEVAHVFVTSAAWPGNLRGASGVPSTGDWSGSDGADALCQTSADAGNLGGDWKALISRELAFTSIEDIGPWYLVGGAKVFNNVANVMTTPLVPIATDEQGMSQDDAKSHCVWTGVVVGGARVNNTCLGWNSIDSNGPGQSGDFRESDFRWLDNGQNSCAETCHLYCIEQ